MQQVQQVCIGFCWYQTFASLDWAVGTVAVVGCDCAKQHQVALQHRIFLSSEYRAQTAAEHQCVSHSCVAKLHGIPLCLTFSCHVVTPCPALLRQALMPQVMAGVRSTLLSAQKAVAAVGTAGSSQPTAASLLDNAKGQLEQARQQVAAASAAFDAARQKVCGPALFVGAHALCTKWTSSCWFAGSCC